MATPSNSHQPTSQRLNIRSRKQLQQFLKDIHEGFLKVVEPMIRGNLVDAMYSANLLTDTDLESLSGRDIKTQKDQARKLWIHMHRVKSVEDFQSAVVPELLKHYSHIIPQKYRTQNVADVTNPGQQSVTDLDEEDRNCLRCEIVATIRITDMADWLFNCGCLEFADYKVVISKELSADLRWTKMFDSCRVRYRNVTPEQVKRFRGQLERYQVDVPENLEKLMSRGIPCTCGDDRSYVLPSSSRSVSSMVDSWIQKSQFDCPTPKHSGSLCSKVMDVKDTKSQSFRDYESEFRGSTHLAQTLPPQPADGDECTKNASITHRKTQSFIASPDGASK